MTTTRQNSLVTVKEKGEAFQAWLVKREDTIARVAPRFLRVERLCRIILTEAVVKNPRLLDCTRNSVMGSILQCAVLGLEPGVGGQCWIVPFRDRDSMIATFVMGYRGYITLGRRAKVVRTARAYTIHENDTFKYNDYPPVAEFLMKRDGERGKPVGAFSALELFDGGRDKLEFMPWAEVMKIRNASPAYRANKTTPAWENWEDEMAKAKVTKRNFKYVATEQAINSAIQVDDELDLGEPQSLPQGPEKEATDITAGGQEVMGDPVDAFDIDEPPVDE